MPGFCIITSGAVSTDIANQAVVLEERRRLWTHPAVVTWYMHTWGHRTPWQLHSLLHGTVPQPGQGGYIVYLTPGCEGGESHGHLYGTAANFGTEACQKLIATPLKP